MNRDPDLTPNRGGDDLSDDQLAAVIRDTLHRKGDAVLATPEGLDRIRAAIDDDRPGAWLLTAAAATVVVAVGLVAGLTRSGGAWVETVGRGGHAAPTGTATTASTTTSTTRPATGPASGLPVYYPGRVGQSYQLFREYHPWAGGTGGTAARVQAAVTQAMSQPPLDPDYLVLWSRHADAAVELSGDQIVITLNEAAAGGSSIAGSGADVIDLQQLIWTATAAAASGGATAPATVLIRAEGPTPDRFGSIDLTQPFRRGSQPGSAEPRAPVWIDSLGQDAAVPTGALTVTGQGVGGPFGLTWTLSLAGRVVSTGSVRPTTEAGDVLGVGLRGVWSLTLDLAEAGRYHLEVAEDVPADAGGVGDSKDFVARAR